MERIRDRKPGSLAHAVTDAFKNDTVAPVQVAIGEAGETHSRPGVSPLRTTSPAGKVLSRHHPRSTRPARPPTGYDSPLRPAQAWSLAPLQRAGNRQIDVDRVAR